MDKLKEVKLHSSFSLSEKNFNQPTEKPVGERIAYISGVAYESFKADGTYAVDRDDEAVIFTDAELNARTLFYQHDKSIPIGKVKLDKTPMGLTFEGEVHEELNPIVYRAVKSGVLDSVSIGMRVKDYELKEVNGEVIAILYPSEVYELSIVGVASSRGATINSVKQYSDGHLECGLNNLACECKEKLLNEKKEMLLKKEKEVEAVIESEGGETIESTPEAVEQPVEELKKENTETLQPTPEAESSVPTEDNSNVNEDNLSAQEEKPQVSRLEQAVTYLATADISNMPVNELDVLVTQTSSFLERVQDYIRTQMESEITQTQN